jgi:hypothetical protein
MRELRHYRGVSPALWLVRSYRGSAVATSRVIGRGTTPNRKLEEGLLLDVPFGEFEIRK